MLMSTYATYAKIRTYHSENRKLTIRMLKVWFCLKSTTLSYIVTYILSYIILFGILYRYHAASES